MARSGLLAVFSLLCFLLWTLPDTAGVLSHIYSKTSPAALAWGSYVISLHKGMVEDPELWIRAWVHSLSKHTRRQLRMATRNFQLYMTWRAHGYAFCFCLFFLF